MSLRRVRHPSLAVEPASAIAGPALGRRSALLLPAALLASSAPGCGSSVPYVWYTRVPRTESKAEAPEYVIGVGDTLDVSVYGQDALKTNAKVRADGRVGLPLVGEVTVEGRHPAELSRDLEQRMAKFVVAPRVLVTVTQTDAVNISAMGEVLRPGTLALERPAELLQAMALIGLSDFADDERIFVVRQRPTFERIRFTYDAIMRNDFQAARFPLRTGDVILIE